MKELSIGEVARQAGLAASALRYYERAGLSDGPGTADEVTPGDELSVPLPAPGGLREVPARGEAQAN